MMLILPIEINQLITNNRLSNLVKLISLSKKYKQYFLQSCYWNKIIDETEKLHKFINNVILKKKI